MPKNEKKENQNDFGEDISWTEGANGTYVMSIQGPKKEAQITRIHSDGKKGQQGQNDQQNQVYLDNVVFAEGGNGTYTLKVSGKINKARIVRMHICDK